MQRLINAFVVIGLLTFASCSQNDPVNSAKNCFLIEMIRKQTEPNAPENNIHARHTILLDNANKPLSEMVEDLLGDKEDCVIKYTYDGTGKLISVEKDFVNQGDTRKDIIYNGNLISEIKYQGVTQQKYIYDSNNRLIGSEIYLVMCVGTTNCTSSLAYTNTYEYENGQSKNPIVFRADKGWWVEASYDSKVAIWNQMTFEQVIPYFNNPTKYVYKDKEGNITSMTDIVYEYNENSYPNTITMTAGDITYEWELTYKCD